MHGPPTRERGISRANLHNRGKIARGGSRSGRINHLRGETPFARAIFRKKRRKNN